MIRNGSLRSVNVGIEIGVTRDVPNPVVTFVVDPEQPEQRIPGLELEDQKIAGAKIL